MTKREKKVRQNEARVLLKKEINKNTVLIIVIKSVSPSGMTRRMRVVINNWDVSYYVAALIDYPYNDKGILVGGCGMDMAFHLASSITIALYNKNKPKWLSGNGGSCLRWITV